MKYILDYTVGESFEYSEEKENELLIFGHSFEVVETAKSCTELI